VNALEIVRSACGIIGLQRPNSLIGSTDLQVIQLRELLNKTGSELAARSSSGWQSLVREATFTTVATEDQGALTTIIGAVNAYRHIVNETIWNRTTKEPVYGPRAAGVWQGLKALTFAGPYAEYRIRGGRLLFLPVPAAGATCAFEYVTKNWLVSSDATTQQSEVEDDEDEPLLDDEILRDGLIWNWKAAKGLDYSQDFQSWETRVIDALARDGTKARLSLNSGSLTDSGIPQAIPRLIGS
jgi:hypothetical protein